MNTDLGDDIKTLTNWEEIAAYLGKGVRTVQRWEKELGLPIRRPSSKNKGIVLAWTKELDDWTTKSTYLNQQSDIQTEMQSLKLRLRELEKENKLLRIDLALRRATSA